MRNEPLYQSPFSPIEKGRASGMKYKLLSENNGTQEYVLVFAKNDEVLSGISAFVADLKIGAARFNAIGALKVCQDGLVRSEKKVL